MSFRLDLWIRKRLNIRIVDREVEVGGKIRNIL